jgi:hypothetical protein
MINLSVYTVSGKCQDFLVSSDKPILEIKNQIQKNHRYLNVVANQEIRLLYKGIELDDLKTLDYYGIMDCTTIQIINKTKPIQIGSSGSRSNPENGAAYHSYGSRRLSESMPCLNIFENYAPSPMELGGGALSKSFSPNGASNMESAAANGPIREIMKQMNELSQNLGSIVDRVEQLEQKVVYIFNSGFIPSPPPKKK